MSEYWRFNLNLDLKPSSCNFNRMNRLDIPFIKPFWSFASFGTPLEGKSGGIKGSKLTEKTVF